MLVASNFFLQEVTNATEFSQKNKEYVIQKICGDEEQRHYLESLGFVEYETVRILSAFFGCYIILVKNSKIGISTELAKAIIVYSE